MNNNMTKKSILMHGNKKLFCNFYKGADYERAYLNALKNLFGEMKIYAALFIIFEQ
jgi:hypothetical protein